jgi:aspartyl-tRNA(Asn)/glutamyl-tRNA(Gln) amidotransferase subunit A
MQTSAPPASSVTEKASELLTRIKQSDETIHAFVACDTAAVLRDAAALDAIEPKARGPLHGYTVAVKDLIDVAGYPTRAGSKFFHRQASTDAPVIARLRAAGALIVGKTNTHEFAWGITTENPHTGRTKNPWDLNRIPGGSSGGAGAAAAAELCDIAIGTDTLGSVRIPAACCGVSGLRTPTGIIPIDNIVPLAPELDTVGPLAYEAALLKKAYAVMANIPPLPHDAPPKRIGRLRGDATNNLEPALQNALDAACATLSNAGIEIIDITWWDARLTDAITVVQQHGAARVHATMIAEHRDDYGADVRERVERALTITDEQLTNARTIVAEARTSFANATNGIESVIMPITPCEAPISPAPPEFRVAVIPLATPASAFALPALAVPIGFGKNACPLSMQILATTTNPNAILTLGEHFQSLTDWHTRRPRT